MIRIRIHETFENVYVKLSRKVLLRVSDRLGHAIFNLIRNRRMKSKRRPCLCVFLAFAMMIVPRHWRPGIASASSGWLPLCEITTRRVCPPPGVQMCILCADQLRPRPRSRYPPARELAAYRMTDESARATSITMRSGRTVSHFCGSARCPAASGPLIGEIATAMYCLHKRSSRESRAVVEMSLNDALWR